MLNQFLKRLAWGLAIHLPRGAIIALGLEGRALDQFAHAKQDSRWEARILAAVYRRVGKEDTANEIEARFTS